MKPEAMELAAAPSNALLIERLADGPPLATLQDVADFVGRDKSNTSKTLDRLADVGLVVRHAAKTGKPPAELTDDGRTAAQALAVAKGRLPLGQNGAWLSWDRIRSDPDNARFDFEPEETRALAVSMRDAGLKQPPHVRPADDAGVHTLAFGERRWRAWGLLIEWGDWATDHLEFCPIETGTDAEIAEIAAAENAQRKDLNHLEKGRDYERLAGYGKDNAEIAAALGKTPEHVQQHRRLLKLDPADQLRVAKGPGFAFDPGRDYVLPSGEAHRFGPNTNGLSLHDALQLLAAPRKPAEEPELLKAMERRDPDSEAPRLTPDDGIALVELSRKIRDRPGREGAGSTEIVYAEPYQAPVARLLAGRNLIRLLTSSRVGRPPLRFAFLTAAGREWLASHPQMEAMVPEIGPGDAYMTSWLNVPEAEASANEPRGMFRDSLARQIAEVTAEERGNREPAPVGPIVDRMKAEAAAKLAVPAEPPADVPAWAAVIVAELDHKVTHQPYVTPRLGHPAARIGQFWLDKRIGGLPDGLVRFHQLGGGVPPLASVGAAGRAWLATPEGQDVSESVAARTAAGEPYATDWLRDEVQTAGEGQAEDDTDDGEAVQQAAEVLARVENLEDRIAELGPPTPSDAASFADICTAAGVPLPWERGKGEACGSVIAANGAHVLTADVNRELPDEMAGARAGLAVIAAYVFAAMGLAVAPAEAAE